MASVQSTFIRFMYEAGVAVFMDRASWERAGNEWDILIRDKSLFRDMRWHGSLGFMRGYVRGKWECRRLDALFARLQNPGLKKPVLAWPALRYYVWPWMRAQLGFNPQSLRRSRQSIHEHYDLGNAFFRTVLDPRMVYSCALWSEGASTLEEAQEAKLDLLCRKLCLEHGDRLLDIGCGWGALVLHAARHYGVDALGVTLSVPQAEWANARIREQGLGDRCRVEVADYRELEVARPFDKVASVGMYEHVGRRNWPVYAQSVCSILAPDGLSAVHTNVGPKPVRVQDPWTEHDIFPDTLLPAISEVEATLGDKFSILHEERLTGQYSRTLGAWCKNFEAAWHDELFPDFAVRLGVKAANEFYRKWRLYLLSCKGSFDCGRLDVLQVVCSHKQVARKDYSFAPARQERELALG